MYMSAADDLAEMVAKVPAIREALLGVARAMNYGYIEDAHTTQKRKKKKNRRRRK